MAHDLELDVDGQPLLQQLLADIAGRLQEAGAEQHDELDDGDDRDGADRLVRSTRGDAGDDCIDEAAGQPNLCRRGDALQ